MLNSARIQSPNPYILFERPVKIHRQAQIRKLVEERQRVTVAELSTVLNVSEATIRRDLDELDGEWVQRTHGGALVRLRGTNELPVLQRMADHSAIKRRIGQAAANLVRPGETIFISSGTTALEAARCLPLDMHLTVISNSLPVVNELAGRSNIDLVVIGGMFRQDELSMVGHPAEQVLREFRTDRTFIGMRAIDSRRGFTNDYMPEILTDRAILNISSQVVVLADHSKFGRIYSVFVAPVTAAHFIITDEGIEAEMVDELRETGIQVIVV
jgi:DeoR/GlpR family transcriptional regulator of sugar metabolism